MRCVVALVVLLAASPAAAEAPTAKQLISAWFKANSNCRGSTEPESIKTMAECDRRERLSGRLDQIGWCYGHEGEAGYQHKWHRCDATSVRPMSDLTAAE